MKDWSKDPSHHEQTLLPQRIAQLCEIHIQTCKSVGKVTSFDLSLFYVERCNPSKHPLSYFSFQPVVHDWFNKGHDMCYPVYVMVHIKYPLLLIKKSTPCWVFSFTIWMVSYQTSSSVVRAFAYRAMGCQIDPSWGGPNELFLVPASAPWLV